MRAGKHSASKTGSGTGSGSELSESASAGNPPLPLSGETVTPPTEGAAAAGTTEAGSRTGTAGTLADPGASAGAAGLLLRTITTACVTAGAACARSSVGTVRPLTGAAACDFVPLP